MDQWANRMASDNHRHSARANTTRVADSENPLRQVISCMDCRALTWFPTAADRRGLVFELFASQSTRYPKMQEVTKDDRILTINDVATILRCSKTHVSHALAGKVRGLPKLTHIAMGRRKLIRRSWLEQWIEVNKSRW